MYTMQEAFEIMCKHIFEQGVQSTNGKSGGDCYCLYRGPNGLKCVIGALIPDSEYKPEYDIKIGMSVDYLYSEGITCLSGLRLDFLEEMQSIHDDGDWSTSDAMRNAFMKTGTYYGLETHFLKELNFSDR